MSEAMSSESRRDGELLRAALAPGKDCPSIEDLGHYLEQKGDQTWRASLKSHLAGCSHCRTEMHMLQEFESGAIGADEAEAVHSIAAELARRSPEVFGHARVAAPARQPWQKGSPHP